MKRPGMVNFECHICGAKRSQIFWRDPVPKEWFPVCNLCGHYLKIVAEPSPKEE